MRNALFLLCLWAGALMAGVEDIPDALVGHEPNESAELMTLAEQDVAAKIVAFQETDDYMLLVQAEEVARSMNRRDSGPGLGPLDARALRLQLKVLLALYAARDPYFDPNARDRMPTLNVMPPKGHGMPGIAPEAIKDPEARKAYREAIARNKRLLKKVNREFGLNRAAELNLTMMWYLRRNVSQRDAVAGEQVDAILAETPLTDEMRAKLTGPESPGVSGQLLK